MLSTQPYRCPLVAGGIAMSGPVNWSRQNNRDRMHRRVVEDVKGKIPSGGEPLKQPRRKVSKTELREQAEAAFLAWRSGQTPKDK